MIPILTTAQMRAIDEASIGGNVTTGFTYMQKAGMGLFDALAAMNITPQSGEIAVVCGRGNNGGDGYVAARILRDKGFRVMCFGLCDEDSLSPEARLAFDEYMLRQGNYLRIDDSLALDEFCRFVLIIDAILGTGITGDPRGVYAEIIKRIIGSQKPVLAVDTPSGLNNDSGMPGDPTVRAACTVTMGFAKIGQLFYPARAYLGALIVKDLGYSQEIVAQHFSNIFLPEISDLKRFLPARKPAGSKFDHGLVLTLCGSRGMTGSATLAALSALRTGCGMVHCAIPGSIVDILSIKLTEPVMHTLEETAEGSFAADNLERITALSSTMHAALIGPGISHHRETSELVRQLVAKLTIPLVLDADGINAFKDRVDELKKHSGELIITPHKGEWERVFGKISSDPAALCRTLAQKAKEFSITIVYKGSPSIVADKQGTIFILPAGCSGMATAGSGDVLAGIITALIAQGAQSTDAAILGVAIHGFAGEQAAEKLGEYAMIAGDIVDNIAGAIQSLCAARKHFPLIR